MLMMLTLQRKMIHTLMMIMTIIQMMDKTMIIGMEMNLKQIKKEKVCGTNSGA
ncbi:hypothetical protein SDC9_168189 [bioreactor metagenome]|uniref:Uncharacterized protein n=1 Tax=bioreactor metagenome TaxID=1076179 RepID=A0A645G4G4_9ZZZZ